MAFRWGDLIEETHQLVVVSGKLFNSAMGKTQLWFMAAQKAAHGFLTYLEHSRTVRFFRNLRYFVKPRGLVKIASNMGAVGVRFSYILGALTVKYRRVDLLKFGAQHELGWFTLIYQILPCYLLDLIGLIIAFVWRGAPQDDTAVPSFTGEGSGSPLAPRFCGAERVPAAKLKTKTKSGWWFGTWILFSPIVGMMIQSDFHIFQRGWNHQPEMFDLPSIWAIWIHLIDHLQHLLKLRLFPGRC